MKRFCVYILSSKSRVLYVGVTSDLESRIVQHRQKLLGGFTATYNVNRLVYFEEFANASDAIGAEKKIKGWLRAKKIALIESSNPEWRDLFEGSSIQVTRPVILMEPERLKNPEVRASLAIRDSSVA